MDYSVGLTPWLLLFRLTSMYHSSDGENHFHDILSHLIEREKEDRDVVALFTLSYYDEYDEVHRGLQLSPFIDGGETHHETIRLMMSSLKQTFFIMNEVSESGLGVQTLRPLPFKIGIAILWINYDHTDEFDETIFMLEMKKVINPWTKAILVSEVQAHGSVNDAEEIINVFNRHFRRLVIVMLVNIEDDVILLKKDAFNGHIVVERLNGDTEVNTSFFHWKYNYLKGYPLKIGYTNAPPYVFKPRHPKEAPGGIEMLIIRAIVEHLKINPIFIEADASEVNENGRAFSFMTNFFDYNVDLDIGCGDLSYSSFQGLEVIEILPPFTFRHHISVALRPLKFDRWRSLYGTLHGSVWLWILLTFITAALLLFLSTKRNEGAKTFPELVFEILSAHFEVGLSGELIRRLSKLFVVLFLFYILIITTLYKADMKTAITVPYVMPPLKSFKDVLDANIKVYLLWEDDPYLGKDHRSIKARKLNRLVTLSHIKDDTDLDFVKGNGSGLFLRDKDKLEYLFFIENFQNYSISIIPEYSFTRPVSLLMAFSHPLYPLFDRLQSYIIESGLPDYWLRETFHYYKLKYTAIPEDDLKPMTLDSFSIIFYLWLLMMLFDVFSFLIEKVFFSSSSDFKQKVHKFQNV